MSTFKNFVDESIAKLSNLARLEVNTLVGNFTFKEVSKTKTTIIQDSTKERMTSQINLLTGDITTAMTEKFVDEYKDLREYHLVRESQGHKIINQNIETLRKISKAIKDFYEDKEDSSYN